MPSYDEFQEYILSSVNIKNNYVESGRVGTMNELREHTVNISTRVKVGAV